MGRIRSECFREKSWLQDQKHQIYDPAKVNLKPSNEEFCCDEKQVELLDAQMTLPRQFLSRCPSCLTNFIQLWCDFTCSPNQANFVRVIASANDLYLVTSENYVLRLVKGIVYKSRFRGSRTLSAPVSENKTHYITEVAYYVRDSYADGLFQSCKDVRAIGTDYALSFMCGMSISECDLSRWFTFMGSYNEDIGIPFHINFIPTPSSLESIQEDQLSASNATIRHDINPPSTRVFLCSEAAYPNGSPCSCQDCPQSCVAESPFPFIIQDGDLSDFKPTSGTLDDSDLGAIDTLGSWIESQLELICAHYGQLCVKHPLSVFIFGTIIALFCSSGILFVRFTTDPVELWSSWTSRARGEKYFSIRNLGVPFYRTEQLIIYPRDQSFWPHENQSDVFEPGFYGPALRKSFLQEVAELQEAVTNLIAVADDGTRIALTDVCYKPLAPDNQNCAIMTLLNYFQNNMTLLNQTSIDEWSGSQFDYLDHIITCTQNPYQPVTRLGIPCLSACGIPIQPYVVLGEFNSSSQWDSARGVVITILLNNHITAMDNKYAAAWEKVLDEIDRESQSDVFTILISYIFMFAYVAFALGQYQVTGNNLATLLVHSKIMVGLAGVLIVALSVTSSIGLYAFYGIPATTIVLEVQPFLVLAVGVDNIFIFVQAYQRAEEPLSEPLHLRISRISGEVIPSMLLSSLSECLCFLLERYLRCLLLRPEVCCCLRITTVESVNNDGYMLYMFSNYYAPFLLSKYVRIIVIFLFAGWLTSSFAVMGNIPLGFDQKMAVPELVLIIRLKFRSLFRIYLIGNNNYEVRVDEIIMKSTNKLTSIVRGRFICFSYFKSMDRFLSVGPPVYFVIKGEIEFSDPYEHNKICSSAGCAIDSLGAQIAHAARWSNRSYIAYPAMNWLDDYIDWLQPFGDPPCCRVFPNRTFALPQNSESCIPCNVEFLDGRPRSDLFYNHLTHFFSNNPSIKCAKGGHAAYGSAIKLSRRGRILSTHFMTYHTVLKTSSDFINAMTSARRIAANITAMLNKDRDGQCPIERILRLYEQYMTIVMDACVQLVLSLLAIFVVTAVFLGLDPWSAFIIDLTISCVLFNLIGLMYWWSIDFNAISVVNLVMTVGISVEFCSHIVRSFALSIHRDRLMRARHSLANMGSSVLSGITLTKFGGILVLAFAHSQIFKVYYFRMFLGIVLIGAAHGLVFLPVLLSYIGPPMNKRKLIMKTRSESCCINDCTGTVTKACLTKHSDPPPLTNVF
ncbi:Niemann-Pick C1 protein [Dirofilaria immitis]|nr:Niemann-Pick C1 protein [Dirofilaria immitis]